MQADSYPLRGRASRMLPASTASGSPGRAEGAPAASQDSRVAGAAAAAVLPMHAQAPALELAPAPGIASTQQAAFVPAELVNNPAPPLLADATGSDGSLRASLARMMAAEHRWPAPALATSYASYAEQPADLSGAPLSPEYLSISSNSSPSPYLLPKYTSRTVMEVAVCAIRDDSDACAALCASPELSQVPAAAPPLPAEFLPPAMTLAELTALATGDPDTLKAFVDGQPSSALAGALPSWGQALRCV